MLWLGRQYQQHLTLFAPSFLRLHLLSPQQEMSLDPKSAPELRLDTYARITGAWATKDPEVSS